MTGVDRPQSGPQQTADPNHDPLPADGYGAGLDELIELSRRGYSCTVCIETKWPPEGDLAGALAAIRGLLRRLFTIDAAPAGTIDGPKAVAEVGEGILALYDAVDRIAPAAATPSGMVTFASTMLMAGGRGLPIMASPIDPGITIPVSELIPLLEALVQELEEAANVAGGRIAEQARALVENLKQILRMLRSMAPGATLGLARVLQMLRAILPRLLELLRSGLTGARFRMVLQAILRFAQGIAAFIPEAGGAGAAVGGGGAAGGGAAGAGAAGAGAAGAAGTALYTVTLILLAFGLGCLIGWLIGNIKIGDRTIHEWLGDCFYWLFWAPDSACDGAYAIFTRYHSMAQAARADGDKEAEIGALMAAIAGLEQYIRLECESDLAVYRRQVERMRARIKELLAD